MKNFYEKLKDILYASMDYIIMLSIVLLVVLVIGWRLDILFQKDILAIVSNETSKIQEIVAEEEAEKEKKEEEDKNQSESEEEKVEIIEEEKTPPPVEEKEPVPEKVENIEVKIPAGSFPAQIGSILESKGLVNTSTDFIKKAVDLNLDTKLQSGTFSIPSNSSMEKIVKIIAKQKT